MRYEVQATNPLTAPLARLILRTLCLQELHGYGIVQSIRQSSGHELLIEDGSLYPIVQRLELNGWIDGVWRVTSSNRRAKFYRITAAGRQQVAVEAREYRRSTCRQTLAKRSACFAMAFTSLASSEPTASYKVFYPKRDCDRMPALIRDAAKDASIPLHSLCYINDRARFALDAGEPFAADLDRVGDSVRVVIPFGHLLVINGSEPAVQMAVRCYDAESRRLLTSSRFAGTHDLGGKIAALDRASQAVRTLRRSYASLLAPYNHLSAPVGPQSKSPGRK